MEQRRRPPTKKINYRVNSRSGHIYTNRELPRQPYREVTPFRQAELRGQGASPKSKRKKAKVSYMAEYRNMPQKKSKRKKRGFIVKRFILVSKQSFRRFRPVIGIALLIGLSFVAVYQNAQLQRWGLSVSEANAKLIELQNQNEALKQEKAELTNLDRIERIAKNDLKMVMPSNTVLFEPKASPKDNNN